VEQFQHLASQCNFPWLLANVLDPALGDNIPLGRARRTHMLTASNGVKIGLIGLGEREWLDTINTLPPNLVFKSPAATAEELVPQLRADGADMIIALTHMREPNDKKLAEETDGLLDLILGGHDHFYAHHVIKGTHVLRSGTDFKQLSYMEARRSTSHPGKWDLNIHRRDLVSSIAEDAPTLALVDTLTASLKTSLLQPIGFTAAPLDARFATVRRRESNLGNLVADIMRMHHGADAALLAAGTIRGDRVYGPGPLLARDVTDCFPFEDPVVLVRASGRALWAALENAVGSYPALEGRFAQVSGLRFRWDPAREAGSRVEWVEVAGEGIEMERQYVVATRDYMVRGKGEQQQSIHSGVEQAVGGGIDGS
jgi:5'-nucleotidase